MIFIKAVVLTFAFCLALSAQASPLQSRQNTEEVRQCLDSITSTSKVLARGRAKITGAANVEEALIASTPLLIRIIKNEKSCCPLGRKIFENLSDDDRTEVIILIAQIKKQSREIVNYLKPFYNQPGQYDAAQSQDVRDALPFVDQVVRRLSFCLLERSANLSTQLITNLELTRQFLQTKP